MIQRLTPFKTTLSTKTSACFLGSFSEGITTPHDDYQSGFMSGFPSEVLHKASQVYPHIDDVPGL